MAAKQIAVLITGANRGVGRGLAEAYLARPNHTVVAAVRDPTASTARSLEALVPAAGSRVLLVKIDSQADADAAEAVGALRAAGVEALDIVIANAGIAPPPAPLATAALRDLREAFDVNTVAPLALFQAAAPLLQAATTPRFVAISTALSSIQNLESTAEVPLGAYAASKAALNYLVRRVAFEHPWLNAFVMHPGFVQTDMGSSGARDMGLEKADQTIEESVGGIIGKVDAAATATTSGGFHSWNGQEMKF